MAFDPKWTERWTLAELRRVAQQNGFRVNVLKINGTTTPIQIEMRDECPTIHVTLRVLKTEHPVTIREVLNCEVESKVCKVIHDPIAFLKSSSSLIKTESRTKSHESDEKNYLPRILNRPMGVTETTGSTKGQIGPISSSTVHNRSVMCQPSIMRQPSIIEWLKKNQRKHTSYNYQHAPDA